MHLAGPDHSGTRRCTARSRGTLRGAGFGRVGRHREPRRRCRHPFDLTVEDRSSRGCGARGRRHRTATARWGGPRRGTRRLDRRSRVEQRRRRRLNPGFARLAQSQALERGIPVRERRSRPRRGCAGALCSLVGGRTSDLPGGLPGGLIALIDPSRGWFLLLGVGGTGDAGAGGRRVVGHRSSVWHGVARAWVSRGGPSLRHAPCPRGPPPTHRRRMPAS